MDHPDQSRRAHPRFPMSLCAEIQTGAGPLFVTATNLSEGGVGLRLDRLLLEQSSIALSLFLVDNGIEDESSGTIDLRGQVIWAAPTDQGGYEAGIRFVETAPAQLVCLREFLARLT